MKSREPLSETERVEREELARGQMLPGEPPVAPRPAATVITARPSQQGFEVLLLRRPRSTRFAAGAYVFAGGTVDPGDSAGELTRRLPAAWSLAEAPPPAPSAALVAALRELYEETGFLLSDQPAVLELRRARRLDLLSGSRSFEEIVRELEASFHTLRIACIARWITPERFARRYDTYFFFVEHGGEEPELTDELEAHVWLAPAEAVRRFHDGVLPMLFPTRKTLETLAALTDLDAVWAAYERAEIQPILPRLHVSGERVWPVLPGDPRYDSSQP